MTGQNTDPGVKLTKNSGTHEVDATLYRSLVGTFFYLANTGPEIAFAVGLVADVYAVSTRDPP